MSRNLTPDDVAAIKLLVSAERLGTFRGLTKSEDDALELHQSAMMLSGALMSVTGMIEIALRNAICNQLHADLKAPNFLRNPPDGISWATPEANKIRDAESQARRAAYSKMDNAAKQALNAVAYPTGVPQNIKHSTLAKRRQASIIVSDGQIISQLTIFFWKRLFSDHYEPTLWKRSLKKVFPNKRLDRSDIAEQLETIYQIRNRLAHHEPVYGIRLTRLIGAIDFVTESLGSRYPNKESPLGKFLLAHRENLDSQVAIFQKSFDRLTS